jgi:hypothetical protein
MLFSLLDDSDIPLFVVEIFEQIGLPCGPLCELLRCKPQPRLFSDLEDTTLRTWELRRMGYPSDVTASENNCVISRKMENHDSASEGWSPPVALACIKMHTDLYFSNKYLLFYTKCL